MLDEEYSSLSSSIYYLHSPVTSSLLGPNILLNAQFSNNLSLRSSLNVSDQVSHPYKTTGKITVQCILTLKFFDSKLEDKRFCTEWLQALPDFNLLSVSSWIEFWCINMVPKYSLALQICYVGGSIEWEKNSWHTNAFGMEQSLAARLGSSLYPAVIGMLGRIGIFL